MRNLRSNIALLSIIQILRSFLVIIPVLTLFYRAKGLSMQDIMTIQAVFSAFIVLFEVPSGYFSDVMGRRWALIAGAALIAIGFGMYVVSGEFWGFLIAEIILGVGFSFMSGTDSALLFDTLQALGEQSESIVKEGRQLSYSHFSESAAAIVGGFLAALSLDLPMYVQFGVASLAVPVAWMIVEPPIIQRGRINIWTDLVGAMRYAIVDNRRLRRLLLLSGSIGAGTLSMVWFIQPYMQQAGLPVAFFGIAWSALNTVVGASSLRAHILEKKMGERRIVILLIVGLVLGYLLCGVFTSLWSLSALLLFYLVRGINNPIFTGYINGELSSEYRATILSLRQLATRLIFVIVGPMLGWVNDAYSLQTALLVAGVFFGMTTSVLAVQRQ